MIVPKTLISKTFENISPFEVQTPGSGIWKNPGSETLAATQRSSGDPDSGVDPGVSRSRFIVSKNLSYWYTYLLNFKGIFKINKKVNYKIAKLAPLKRHKKKKKSN